MHFAFGTHSALGKAKLKPAHANQHTWQETATLNDSKGDAALSREPQSIQDNLCQTFGLSQETAHS